MNGAPASSLKRWTSRVLCALLVADAALALGLAANVRYRALRGMRSNEDGMAWGIVVAMMLGPAWLALLVASVVVDLRAPRTRAALRGALAFPVACVLGLFLLE